MKTYRQYLRIGAHVVFWLCTAYMFCHYSYLRPMSPLWHVEVFHVALLSIMVYLHYFLLIPYLLKRRLYGSYWTLTLLIFFLLTIWELYTFSPQLRELTAQMGSSLYSKYLMAMIINTSLRNAGFWAFFFILRMYEELNVLLSERDAFQLRENHSVSFADNKGKPVMLHIEQLSYIQCDRNVCIFYLKNGLKFKQYASLSQWEDLLVPQWAIRVNRDTLVLYDAIVSFTDDSLCDTLGKQMIELYKGDRRKYVYEELMKRVPERCDVVNVTGRKEEQNMDLIMDEELTLICKKIAKQPYLNAKALSEASSIPLRTMERKLSLLKEQGVIRYDGSARKGGYVLIDSRADTM